MGRRGKPKSRRAAVREAQVVAEPRTASLRRAAGALASAARRYLSGLRARPITLLLLLLTAWAAAAIHVAHAFTAHPNFDEHFQIQFLWMTSVGIFPREKFLCPYPPAAYYLFAPLMYVLKQDHTIFLTLRALCLVPFALFVAAIALLAHGLRRHVGVAVCWALVALASKDFPAFWEIRFDALAWALALLAVALLLLSRLRAAVFLAATLATFSVLLAPKHILMIAGLAAAYGLYRLLWDRARLGGDVAAALAGAALPFALLTLVRPAFLADSWDLAMMNIRSQHGSTYPVGLVESLAMLFVRDPLASAAFWLGPVLFLLHLRRIDARGRAIFLGLLAGAIATVATLPCGYTQYISLIWAMCAPFIPWMTPSRDARWLPLLTGAVLLLNIAAYAGQEVAFQQHEGVLAKQIRLQQALEKICPPGDTDAAGPFGHTWCRGIPGYVFIDNQPSYAESVVPERKPLFTEDYYYAQLKAAPPAYFCPFTTADNQPPAYLDARVRFMRENAHRYKVMWLYYDGHALLEANRLVLYVRNDRVPFASAVLVP